VCTLRTHGQLSDASGSRRPQYASSVSRNLISRSIPLALGSAIWRVRYSSAAKASEYAESEVGSGCGRCVHRASRLGARDSQNLPGGYLQPVLDAEDQHSRRGHADREHDAERAVAAVRDDRAADDGA
jgi:hypothetical protein